MALSANQNDLKLFKLLEGSKAYLVMSKQTPVQSSVKAVVPTSITVIYIFFYFIKWVHPIIFSSNVFHNSHLIQKCIQNQQLLLILYTLLNQMRVGKNIRRKDDRITSLYIKVKLLTQLNELFSIFYLQKRIIVTTVICRNTVR